MTGVVVMGCEFPSGLLYDVGNHVWYAPRPDGTVTVGLTRVAVALADNRVFAFTPKRAGRPVERGKSCATIESSKWVGPARIAFDDKVAESAGNPYILPHTRQAILDAFRRAGIADCWGVDAIETHDCFTTSEYMAIDHFGLTAPGESWKAVEEGTIAMGGRLPITPSGGLIGAGHPVGATGARQLLDAWKQVTHTAGDFQVEGAKRVATLNLGGSGTTSCAFVVGV